MSSKCTNCGQWLNRAAQINLIITSGNKVLLLQKSELQLEDESVNNFYGELLRKEFLDVDKKGWYDLPGGDVRQEYTIEDAVANRLKTDINLSLKTGYLLGIYDGAERDPRAHGVSFCYVITPTHYKFKFDKKRIKDAIWVDEDWLRSNKLYSDHHQMLKDYFFSKHKKEKVLKRHQSHNNAGLNSYKPYYRCPSCGQFRQRPVQVDAVITNSKNEILFVKREHKNGGSFVKRVYEDGFLALPGGYVSRGESVRSAIIREVEEETGYKTTIKNLIGFYDSVDRDPKSQGISICFELEVLSPKNRVISEHKTHWISLPNLPKNLAYDHSSMVQDYLKMMGMKVKK